MNINEDLLQGILADNGIYASEQEAVFKAIETKPVDCDECVMGKHNKISCQTCKHYKDAKDYFKPKRNELDNLFIGAPVMMIVEDGITDVMPTTYPNVYRGFRSRLPTIEEAPRNVWLAPWLEMPNEILETHYLAKYRTTKNIGSYKKNHGLHPENWSDVEAVMLIEEFEK